jgi:hypothetical protein
MQVARPAPQTPYLHSTSAAPLQKQRPQALLQARTPKQPHQQQSAAATLGLLCISGCCYCCLARLSLLGQDLPMLVVPCCWCGYWLHCLSATAAAAAVGPAGKSGQVTGSAGMWPCWGPGCCWGHLPLLLAQRHLGRHQNHHHLRGCPCGLAWAGWWVGLLLPK